MRLISRIFQELIIRLLLLTELSLKIFLLWKPYPDSVYIDASCRSWKCSKIYCFSSIQCDRPMCPENQARNSRRDNDRSDVDSAALVPQNVGTSSLVTVSSSVGLPAFALYQE